MAAIANRYAKALVEVCFSEGTHEQVGRELRQFEQLLQQNSELSLFYSNPAIPAAKKKKATSEILKKLAFSVTTSNFLFVLIDNYRMSFLVEIRKAFFQFLNEKLGMVRVDVTCALPVDDPTQSHLSTKLEQLTKRKVQLVFHADPELIGGVVTRIGDTIYDGSVRQHLTTLKNRLSTL